MLLTISWMSVMRALLFDIKNNNMNTLAETPQKTYIIEEHNQLQYSLRN